MEFLKKIIIILQAVQKSYYIISELEKMNVIDLDGDGDDDADDGDDAEHGNQDVRRSDL